LIFDQATVPPNFGGFEDLRSVFPSRPSGHGTPDQLLGKFNSMRLSSKDAIVLKVPDRPHGLGLFARLR
jgi:hypothetical protein